MKTKLLSFIFAFGLFSLTAYSQRNNCDNNAGGQLTVGAACTPVAWNSTNNTNYWDNAAGCGATDNDDVWGWFTATSTNTTITYQPAAGRDAILSIFTGACNGTTMTSAACANAGGNGVAETISGPTVIGNNYRVRVQRNGSNANMNGTICVFNTSVGATHNIGDGDLNICSGDVYDSGGTADYGNNETITETYCSNAGNCIQVTFNSFDTEACCDDLTIYDGPNAASPMIGTYAGTTNPGTITSSSGCLTFVWDSDGSVVRAGWDATISCIPCPVPTCSDGIQNQGETGIDCGGPCPACPPVVQPSAACATETFNITTPVTFYDDGGPGGQPCTDGHANNFANANCETTTTICAPLGQTLLVNFNTFAMYNTNSAFDWMKIYEGVGTGGTVLFDNDIGGPDNAPNGGSGTGYGDCGDDTPPSGFCSNLSNCLTFEFHASGVVNREGWDASVSITTGVTCILPITLTRFEGNPFTNYNLLEWTTASEINNDYFVIERSDNGIQFEEIANITGAGNSNEMLNYSLQHKHPKNTEYYRLKQVDFDGNFSYSKIIVINSGSESNIEIYPNPSENDLFFDLKEGIDEQLTITYVSILGRTIQENIFVTSENKKYKTTMFSDLSSGVYFVQVSNESGKVLKSLKVIKK